jgi:hypothetical protein
VNWALAATDWNCSDGRSPGSLGPSPTWAGVHLLVDDRRARRSSSARPLSTYIEPITSGASRISATRRVRALRRQARLNRRRRGVGTARAGAPGAGRGRSGCHASMRGGARLRQALQGAAQGAAGAAEALRDRVRVRRGDCGSTWRGWDSGTTARIPPVGVPSRVGVRPHRHRDRRLVLNVALPPCPVTCIPTPLHCSRSSTPTCSCSRAPLTAGASRTARRGACGRMLVSRRLVWRAASSSGQVAAVGRDTWKSADHAGHARSSPTCSGSRELALRSASGLRCRHSGLRALVGGLLLEHLVGIDLPRERPVVIVAVPLCTCTSLVSDPHAPDRRAGSVLSIVGLRPVVGDHRCPGPG